MGTVPRFLMLAVAHGSIAGCGSKVDTPPPETVCPVTGMVVMKGQPLNEARVTAVPAGADPAAPTTRRYDAITNERGEFQYGAGNRRSDDIPPGKYDVRIRWPEVLDSNDPDREYDQLKGRYSGKAPAFKIDVKPESNFLPPFELK